MVEDDVCERLSEIDHIDIFGTNVSDTQFTSTPFSRSCVQLPLTGDDADDVVFVRHRQVVDVVFREQAFRLIDGRIERNGIRKRRHDGR